ncbi:MAG: DUF192 domain-containing protein [Candidatus Omnitrophota bacterium]
MKITNQTKNTVLADNVVVADTFFKRGLGLLGRKEFKPGLALILDPCNSIHTFFMRFSIDILFVDKNKRVIKAISNLKPFRITPVYFSSAIAIELPAGTIQLSSTSQNDTLKLGDVSIFLNKGKKK